MSSAEQDIERLVYRYAERMDAGDLAGVAALFDRADELGVEWFRDFDLPPWEMKPIHAVVADFVRGVDRVHLSIDLDVLPAAVMPAVSAPAACGVPLQTVEALIGRILAEGRTVAVGSRKTGEKSRPWNVGPARRPATDSRVGAMSTELTSEGLVVPGAIRPGHRAISGVRIPLS